MARSDPDRNLLFGILALQMDFVDRDGLVEAMNAWVLEKHRPLGEILERRGNLDSKDRSVLDLFEAHMGLALALQIQSKGLGRGHRCLS